MKYLPRLSLAALLWSGGCLGFDQFQSKVAPSSSESCAPLDGVYQYYGKTEWRSDRTVKSSNSSTNKIGFNDALTRVGVAGDVQGVKMNYSRDKQAYEIEVFGKNLLTGAQIANMAISYELPVTCEDGHWLHQLHIAGGGEGVTSIGDRTFFLSKGSDRSLHIHVILKGTSTSLLFIKSRWNESADYSFAPIEQQ